MQVFDPEITVIATFDDIPVRGNACATDDPDLNKKIEDEILARLEQGDVWAWASVEVKAEFRGLSASAYLGCCCYESEEDFKADGYYQDLVAEATNELADLVADLQGVEIRRL